MEYEYEERCEYIEPEPNNYFLFALTYSGYGISFGINESYVYEPTGYYKGETEGSWYCGYTFERIDITFKIHKG